MSLRKSPTRTPALLAANRRNAKKSTGPRTAQGKAWSRLNHLRTGMRSPEYINFLKALIEAPPGQVERTARDMLSTELVPHPLFMEAAEMSIQIEIDMFGEAD